MTGKFWLYRVKARLEKFNLRPPLNLSQAEHSTKMGQAYGPLPLKRAGVGLSPRRSAPSGLPIYAQLGRVRLSPVTADWQR